MQPRLGVILVVEDDGLVRFAIVDALRDAGWHVLETGSGECAIALLRSKQSIDVIFTDIQLAGPLSGWDVGEQGRSVQATMPVIYASGNAPDRSRMVLDSLFFDKPYVASEVVEARRAVAYAGSDTRISRTAPAAMSAVGLGRVKSARVAPRTI